MDEIKCEINIYELVRNFLFNIEYRVACTKGFKAPEEEGGGGRHSRHGLGVVSLSLVAMNLVPRTTVWQKFWFRYAGTSYHEAKNLMTLLNETNLFIGKGNQNGKSGWSCWSTSGTLFHYFPEDGMQISGQMLVEWSCSQFSECLYTCTKALMNSEVRSRVGRISRSSAIRNFKILRKILILQSIN